MFNDRSVSKEFLMIYRRYISQVENYIKNETIFNEYRELKPYLEYVLTARGKMIRPFLLMLFCDAVGGNSEKILPLACGIELGHIASLIHDDIIDKAELRRGQITIYRKFGIPTAILVGDLFVFTTFHELSKLQKDIPLDRVVSVLEMLAKTGMDMSYGEQLEILCTGKLNPTIKEYLRIIAYKTASCFKNICKAGAILAGGNSEVVNRAGEYGFNIGMAFQIMDDLSDLVKSETEAKKTKAIDLKNKIVTFPILFTLSRANAEQKRYIEALFKECSPIINSEKLITILEEVGAIQETKRLAQNYLQKAKDSLKVLRPSQHVEVLKELADLIVR